MRIHEVIKAKASQEIFTISPDATVRELLAALAEHNIGALVVSTDGSSVDGIVSERDVVRRLNDDAGVLDGNVGAIMTTAVRTAQTDQDFEDVMTMMTEHRFRHVPVVSDGALVGIVSIGDIVKHRIDQLQFERDQLGHYVQQS